MIDIELSRHLAMADGRQSVSYYCIDKVHSATGKRCLVLCKMFRVHFLSTMAGECVDVFTNLRQRGFMVGCLGDLEGVKHASFPQLSPDPLQIQPPRY